MTCTMIRGSLTSAISISLRPKAARDISKVNLSSYLNNYARIHVPATLNDIFWMGWKRRKKNDQLPINYPSYLYRARDKTRVRCAIGAIRITQCPTHPNQPFKKGKIGAE